MKKMLTLLVAVALLMSLASGLTVAAADEAATELEPMTISVGHWDIENNLPEGYTADPILQTVMDKFNVTFTAMNVGWGDYRDKYNVWAASNTMPDISGGIDIVGSGTYIAWVDDGVVQPLPDDLSAYPNVAKYMDLPEVQAYRKNDHNYFFPRMTYEDPSYWCMDRGLLIRKDWLDNLGLEMPTNAEELLEVMRAFTEDDPDGSGAADTIGFAYNDVFPTSQQIACFGYTDNRWVKMEDGNWKQPVFEEVTLPLIDFLRTAYKNGRMDQDFASRASGDCQELFAAGRIGILAKQNSPKHIKTIYDLWVVAQPDVNFFDAVAIVPLEGEDCYQFQEMSYWSETYVPSSVDAAKLERIMMIMDYLYSDEGVMLTSYGFEGEDYEFDENGNIVSLLPLNEESGKQMLLSDKYTTAGFLASLAAWNGDMLQYQDPTIPQEIRDMCQTEYERRSSTWQYPNLDWEVAALDLQEKLDMSASVSSWSTIIADTSDTPTEELYQNLLAEWNSQGYEACWQAVTAAAAELGK